ncbi:MAG: pantoate--beta-alanine ligase, partial [Bradymonadaceae bacterium]
MQVFDSIRAFREARARLEGTVAFVPTMGFLHEGHLEMMREGLKGCDHLVVSIFVNPTQFGPNEDFERYPRDPAGDRAKCASVGCELLLMPEAGELYGPTHATTVSVSGLTDVLCGLTRPGHFDGVATIVTKLFNIVRPDVAIFGDKDYQQLAIIRQMVTDLDIDVEIVGYPIVREPDGLAKSSRNRGLSEEDRRRALSLSCGLISAHWAYSDGERNATRLVSLVAAQIPEHPEVRVDYITCVDPESLRPYGEGNEIIADEDGAQLAVAAYFGNTRLIDNIRLDDPLPELLASGGH